MMKSLNWMGVAALGVVVAATAIAMYVNPEGVNYILAAIAAIGTAFAPTLKRSGGEE